MDKNGIKNNKYYEEYKVNKNIPICYSCGFNESKFSLLNMCKVKTKKELMGQFYVKSDPNGDIYVNFCSNCILCGFTEGL
ncbi:hypothetical protein [Spiroplasma endosymbiont of Atherix ibis]|uniref:hypothetical protein n=1 Tax=Spiroplasma endosymbiont of Atherix ibis TaxID=3066291 RepID=UPI0030D2EC30